MVQFPIIYISLLYIHFIKIKSTTISLPLSKINNLFYLFATFYDLNDSPLKERLYLIDITTQYSLVSIHQTSELPNRTETSLLKNDQHIPVTTINNKLTFNNNVDILFTYYNIFDPSFMHLSDIRLPFAFNYHDKSFLMTYSFKKQKKINIAQFTLDPFSNQIYFGDIPNAILSSLQYKSSFQIDNKFDSWRLEIDAIIVKESNKITHIINAKNNYIEFSTTINRFLVPEKIWKNEFYKIVLGKLIRYGICYISNRGNLDFIICNEEDKEDFPTLGFRMVNDGKIYEIALKDFVSSIGIDKIRGTQRCEIVFGVNNIFEDNIWVFGAEFMNKVVSVFNYEQEKVSFYSHSPYFITNEIDKVDFKYCELYLYVICLCVLIIGIGGILLYMMLK